MRLGVVETSVRAKCADCTIRHRAVCAQCTEDELVELERIKSYRTFRAGEPIAFAEEPLPVVGSVVRGVAMLSRMLPDGRRQMVGLLLPSDFLGRPWRPTISYDVVASTETTFCLFRKTEFEHLLVVNPHIERRLLEMTLDELDAAREWMLLLGRKTARERIASLFVIMARRDALVQQRAPGEGLRFPLYISREAMADYLGLTIETVSRQVSALSREGLIVLVADREVEVPDFARLQAESGEEPKGGLSI